MKYTDIKIGDRIRVLKYPGHWSSQCINNCPKEVIYPLEGEVIDIKSSNTNHIAANIGGWGFDISSRGFKFEILKPTYEIF